MCCLLEKDPVAGRVRYSPTRSGPTHSKSFLDCTDQYRTRGQLELGKVMHNPKYSTIKTKRSWFTQISTVRKRNHAIPWYGSAGAVVSRRQSPARVEPKISLLDVMRSNRAKTIQVLSVIVCGAMLLSLACSLLFGVHAIDPVVALLTFVTFSGFFLVGKAGEGRHVGS